VTAGRLLKCLLVAVVLAGWGVAETGGQEPATPEMSSTSSPYTFKVQRNEVPVRVIVRDAQGRAVRNLTKDDFLILDNGKPQVITGFSTEGGTPASGPAPGAAKPAVAARPSAIPQVADRFVAFYFDDLVMDFEGLSRSRSAASKYLQTSLKPGDRVAIFTSSGQGNLDFTADRDKLQEALSHLRPNGFINKGGKECPDLSDYEAYLIDELHDSQALTIATQKVILCECGGDASICQGAALTAQMAARRRWSQAEGQARYSLRGLENLVRRLAVLPGQRAIVFVSPGFLSQSQLQMISEIIDRAVRAGVVVNSLDPRGLYAVIPGGDATQSRATDVTGILAAQLVQMQLTAAQRDGEVLAQMADGTGGVYFHNNNDLDAGFRAAGGLAEFSYVLVFSPSDLKRNGKYHHLKVRLTGQGGGRGLTLQARRGYFAPRTAPTSAQAEQEELTNAMYSRDELNPSRLSVTTRFFKSGPMEARVTIVAHLDPQLLSFRTEGGRNADEVTFVTVIFDSNGNFVQGIQKKLELHLRAATLEKMRATGISIADNFLKLTPGTYLVREVVKDRSGLLSSANDTFEIPY
jgi:VWFA-related protein